MGQGISNTLCRATDLAEEETIFNVFSYDVMSDRDSNLSPPRQRADALRVEPWSQVYRNVIQKKNADFILIEIDRGI